MFKNQNYIKNFFAIFIFIHAAFITATICTKKFTNSGIFHGQVAEIIAEENLVNTGTICADESIYIECGNLSGNGVIKGPKIKIYAKNFNFTGSIECDGECTIITQRAIDHWF